MGTKGTWIGMKDVRRRLISSLGLSTGNFNYGTFTNCSFHYKTSELC